MCIYVGEDEEQIKIWGVDPTTLKYLVSANHSTMDKEDLLMVLGR